jgi:competence protein ComEA
MLWLSLASMLFVQELPPGTAKALVQRACTSCHELSIGSKQRMDRERWTALVEDMVDRGAKLTDEEFAQVVDYLAVNFGRKVNVNQATAAVMVSELGLQERNAAAIVKHRDANGPFKDLDGLKKVPGLDAAKIETLKDRLAF